MERRRDQNRGGICSVLLPLDAARHKQSEEERERRHTKSESTRKKQMLEVREKDVNKSNNKEGRVAIKHQSGEERKQ